MSTSAEYSADTPTMNVPEEARSSPIMITTENMTLSLADNENETVRPKSDEMSLVSNPSENGQNKCRFKPTDLHSTNESDYVHMQPIVVRVPEIITPYATIPLEGPEYDFIDERKLDQPSHINHNVNSSDSTPIPPPRPEGNYLPPLPRGRPPSRTYLQTFPKTDRPLSPLRIIDHSEPEWERMQLESGKQILIQGIPFGMPIKDVGISFETEILTEGDSFEDIKVDRTHREAVVTLKSRRVRNELLKRSEFGEKFMLQDNEVSLSPYYQASSDILKVYILGLTDDTTTDDISKYIEDRCGMRPSDVIKGTRPEIALVCFDNPPDLTQIESAFAQQPPEVNKWSILLVEQTKRVKLRGVAMETTPEVLKHYFENDVLSKDRAIDSIIYRDNFQDCIVTFVNIEDAETVIKQKIHTVNDAQLDVSLYYQCLDWDEEYLLKIPGPIKLQSPVQVSENLYTV
ncbi:uncharacterized protein LOC128547678 [Mercenaria mercenaria]|uniref:uncharacterized protein LOC128547678 n=1 Tax=Mercenaria mercenaria TaxID=6596 RepID=UPI00234F9B8F|nr:uncharacterized protein LOC128547678 [Mercenaria mercenaria]